MLKNGEYFRLRTGGKRIIIELNDIALEAFGDVLRIELPKRGALLQKGAPLATLMTTKGIFKLPAPLSGQIMEVNAELAKSPELLFTTSERWVAILIAQNLKPQLIKN